MLTVLSESESNQLERFPADWELFLSLEAVPLVEGARVSCMLFPDSKPANLSGCPGLLAGADPNRTSSLNLRRWINMRQVTIPIAAWNGLQKLRWYSGIKNSGNTNSRKAEPRNLGGTLFDLDEIYARLPSIRNLR